MSRPLAPGDLFDNRYRVLREIGGGGGGKVYQVNDVREKGRILALKILIPTPRYDRTLRRFQREFHLLSRLSHPNLVQVFEAGTDGDSPYFTMEYLAGRSLADTLKSPGSPLCRRLRQDLRSTISFLSQVCSALGYIHGAGIVHRDLKPSNFMLCTPGPEGFVVKLLDMGLAFGQEGIDLVGERGVTGTAHYMSPEQVRGAGVDGRADLYALGVVLYEILTGRLPFEGEDFASVALRHVREAPVPPRNLRPDTPVLLQQVVMTCLEKEPFHRYGSAEELLAGVSGIARGEALAASPVGSSSDVHALLAPRFVGRLEELAVLRRLIEDAKDGRGAFVAITGEAGVGKTALMDEFRSQARLAGFRVLSGKARGASAAPFHPLTEALGDWLVSPEVCPGLPKSAREELSRFFPRMTAAGDQPGAEGVAIPADGADRQKFLSAVGSLFRTEGKRRPVALLVEDAQEADEGSLEFLEQLPPHLPNTPLLACVCLRGEEGLFGAGDSLPTFRGVQEGVHLPLSRLTLPEVHQVVDSMLADREASEVLGNRVFDRAEGNPLFVIEMVKALVEKGRISREGGRWRVGEEGGEGLPETLQGVIQGRLAGLDEEAMTTARYAAVLGRDFEFDSLMAASRIPEVRLIEALERLRRSGVVLEEVPKAVYRFSHGLLQSVLCEGIGTDDRRRLHREVGEALEGRFRGRLREVAEALAHHFSEARVTSKAISYLKEAGDRAGDLGAAKGALEFYERALGLIQVHHLEDEAEGRTQNRYLDLLCHSAYFLSVTGRSEEAYRRAGAVLRLASSRRELHPRAKALAVLAGVYWSQERLDKAVEAATEALGIYGRLADRPGEASTLQTLSVYHWHSGAYDEAAKCILLAARKYRALGGAINRIKSCQMMARAHSMKGDFLKAGKYHREAILLCDKAGEQSLRYVSLALVRRLCLLRGQFRVAEKYAMMEKSFWQESGSKRYLAEHLINIGDIYLERENLEEAERQYADALEMLAPLRERPKSCLAFCRLAEIAIRKRDLPKAVEYVRQGQAMASSGDFLRQNQAWRVMGMVKAALGQAKEAERCFSRSITVVRGNLIYDLGCSYFEAGRFYRSIGSPQKAARHLREAEAIFARMGATHFARKAVDELGRIMSKPSQNDRKARAHGATGRRGDRPDPDEARRERGGKSMGVLPASSAAGRGALAADRLRTLIEVTQTLNAILDLDALLSRALDLLLDTMKAERGLILLAEPGEDLTIRTHRARRMGGREATRISFSLIRDAIASGHPVRASDAARDPRFVDRQSVADYRIRSVICVPFRTRNGQTVGALYVDHRRLADAFSAEDEEFLKAFASLAAVAIDNAQEHGVWKQRALTLQQEVERRFSFGELLGGSAAMQKAYSLLANAAEHDMTVLLTGETGVGKELAARSVHYNSARKDRPFIVQDCGAMPSGLLESELFGHRRGAFTGADGDRAGLFEAADGGTVFLDEICNAPAEVQSRLLRVLQEGEVRRVGETRARKVDVRVIAATNRDLHEETRGGRFREDLYYRLHAFPILLPSMRDRREDIPMLAGRFLKAFSEVQKKGIRGIGNEAMALLLDHDWPGNVRELENEVKRATALTPDGGEIVPEVLSDGLRGRDPGGGFLLREGGSWRDTVEQVERGLIREALARNDQNVTRTAEVLGISRVTLQHKMKRYGLRPVKGGGL